MKNAQGLSINTVILIALGVLILIVLAFVVGGKFKDLGTTASQCDGRCVSSRSDCTDGVLVPMSSCRDSGEVVNNANWCCKSL